MPTIDAQALLNANPCLSCLTDQDLQVLRAGYLYGLAGSLGVTVNLSVVPQAFVGLSDPVLRAMQSAMICELAVNSGESSCSIEGITADNPCLVCLDERSGEIVLLAALKAQYLASWGSTPDDADMLSSMSELYFRSSADLEAIITGIVCSIVNYITGSACDSPNTWAASPWACSCSIGTAQSGLQAAIWSAVALGVMTTPGNLTDDSGNEFTDDFGNNLGLNP